MRASTSSFVLALLLSSSGPSTDAAPAESLERRIADRAAVEDVYWRHRIWPAENPTPKPARSPSLSDAALRAKVEDTLRMSSALDVLWHRPLRAEQVQAELERMVRDSRAPDVLSELFGALDNDPDRIAETLARPLLVERLVRGWYAYDERFHGDLRRVAESALAAARQSGTAPAGGAYRESELLRRATDDGAECEGTESLCLDGERWEARLDALQRSVGGSKAHLEVDRWSELEETRDAFVATALRSQRDSSLRVATVTWPKRTFDSWWAQARERFPASVPDATARLSRMAFPREVTTGCTGGTWQQTPDSPLPSEAQYGSAIWTGSEMIVWGGSSSQGGGRYDPATDTWRPTSLGPATPAARGGHTAVWTGTRMIVWGGAGGVNNFYNGGSSFDPVSDTWTALSSVGAPAARSSHTAVWSGSEMIVWGGSAGPVATAFSTGGRYDPASDTWRATTTTAAPSPRVGHSAVWSGSEMIVFGGTSSSSGFLATGGRYDPSADAWLPTPTSGAPEGRFRHSAVWTGSEMIVWGGSTPGVGGTNTGARYSPATNSWTSTSNGFGVPASRDSHAAVWTGSRMVVWGGISTSGNTINTGGRYDPATNTWAATSIGANVPSARSSPLYVWTGSEMIVWGGGSDTGGRYDPASDSWVPTSTGPFVPSARSEHTAIWTGAEMIVWGGSNTNTGGRYDPSTHVWTATSTAPGVPAGRYLHSAVWTGTEMIVWGGRSASNTYLSTGGRYDPVTDSWQPTSTGTNVPSARDSHVAVWTGSEMVVWGGVNGGAYPNAGGRYDPQTNSWRGTAVTAATPTGRASAVAIWTGSNMIVWGGYNGSNLASGGRYDPLADAWTATSTAGTPGPRQSHTGIWTGSEMIVWGGANSATGGRYSPATDTWLPTPTTGAPSARSEHVAVWTGSEMIIWGGNVVGSGASNSGGIYSPASNQWRTLTQDAQVPPARYRTTGVWTGSLMGVWGGTPATRSGGFYCPGTPCEQGASCDDANPCTTDSCDLATLQCLHAPTSAGTSCSDGNPCTDDLCDGSGQCVSTPDDTNSCVVDSDLCTADRCSGGSCVAPPLSCDDDGDPCTVGACDPSTGCAALAGCSDPYPCTTSSSWCNDKNSCTDDLCDPVTDRCMFVPNPSSSCSDGNSCTDDRCDADGKCVGTPAVSNSCSDSNPCTDDACSASGECVGVPNGLHPCDDGNPCTNGDTCTAAGACQGVPSASNSCTDGNPCTDDHCDATGHCVPTPSSDFRQCFSSGPTQCLTTGTCLGSTCSAQPYECDTPGGCTVSFCQPNGFCQGPYDSGTPGEVRNLRFASDGTTLTWTVEGYDDPAVCSPSAYVLLTAPLTALPVGSQPQIESCTSSTNRSYLAVPGDPPVGSGTWYLIRGWVYSQGSPPVRRYGPLGFSRSGGSPSPRSTTSCP